MDDIFQSDASRKRRQLADLIQGQVNHRVPQQQPFAKVFDDEAVVPGVEDQPVEITQPGEVPMPEYSALMENVRAVRATHAAVGGMPPAPSSLRARVGSWFVRVVRRALFWYTDEILAFHREATAAIEQIAREIVALRAGLDGLQRQISTEVDMRSRETAALTREIGIRAGEISARTDEIAARMPTLDALSEAVDLNASDILQVRERLREQRAYSEHESASRSHLELEVSEIKRQLRDALEALRVEGERLNQAERRVLSTREGLLSQEMRLSVLLERASKSLPQMSEAQVGQLVREDAHKTDAFYTTFEDMFRGNREEIKERLRVYLPIVKEHGIGGPDMPIVDVGCGRGEWLETLLEAGLACHGVDSNRCMLQRCRERKLPVTEADALGYLTGLASHSVGAVTGFHVIEHLKFGTLVDLFDQVVRVLKPGGVAIFETPNPANILVSTERFYFDPTHRNPLPSPLVRFLAEERGLCRVEIMNLHPWPAAARLPGNGSAVAERFNEVFYGPQDYAVIGWKA